MSLVIALAGIISMTRLQNRELPAIDPPVISVTTVFPGAAPEVVETSVTDVLEDQLNGISGVKHVTSISREQVSQVTIEFDLDRDLEAAANDVRDRVARVRNRLPDEIDEPVVAKRDSDSNAVMCKNGLARYRIHCCCRCDQTEFESMDYRSSGRARSRARRSVPPSRR
jgi:multidrug efflux pump subunit AcrB